MAAKENKVTGTYEEIDEAEEEALLKSDDECEAVRKVTTASHEPQAATSDTLLDEDSLMNEAVNLIDEAEVEEGISEDDTTRTVADTKESDSEEDETDDIDDDDDDDDDNLEDGALREYKIIWRELQSQPYAYDKYVRLCELSHTTDDLDNIRSAYNLFANAYPLSPEIWLKYLSIETNVALSPAEIQKVEQLYKKALRDYYSVDIALEYATLAARTAEPEPIWQEILGTYGLNCLQGREFYKRYRQFISSHGSMSADEKQKAFIQSYLRELKYPLHDMEDSYIEFKVFYEKNKTQITQEINWERIEKDYFKAKEHLAKIVTFEKQLSEFDAKRYAERAALYVQYINESDKFLDENVLQTVYERMVADCCLNVNCWLTYIDFIEYRDEYGRPKELLELPVFQQSADELCRRALRNCTWSEKLYIKRMQLMEKQERTREEVQEVLESSMTAGFQTAEPAVLIWLEYLTYLRRHTDWENEDECDILRKNFNLAWTILGQQWGVLADCNCEILQFWGRLEYGPLQDGKRGKELWTTVMESADNATKSGLWIEFAQLELRRDLDSTRKIYRKALHANGLDNPTVIASAWDRFERCNGNMKTLMACQKECSGFLVTYQKQLQQQTSGEKSPTKTPKGNSKRKLTNLKADAVQEKKHKVSEETEKTPQETITNAQNEHDVMYKEHENQEIDLAKDHLRIFLSNLDYNLNEEDLRAGLPELKIVHINLIRSVNGRSRGFGYLELESVDEVKKALDMDRRNLNGRPVYISSVLRDKEKRQKFKYSDGLEPKKLFVKGLPPDTSKEELEKIFSDYGKVQDVRLVHHKSGKFKNIAYVEFVAETAAGRAVMATDQMELRGHKISVAISAPPPKSNTPVVSASKLLGIKRNKPFEQKPRMSLIPTVVRQKLIKPADTLTTTAVNGTNISAAKNNADFRKLLQKPS